MEERKTGENPIPAEDGAFTSGDDVILAAARARQERETAAFFDLFPEGDLDLVPDEVWQRVKSGASLSDSYAAYRIREERKEAAAAERNRYNWEHSSGVVSGVPATGFYSASQVSAMSEPEVRAHYDAIMESMARKTFFRE